MKKTIFPIILFIILFSAGLNVQAEEIQLTDYNYAYAKRVLDGFSITAFSDTYECGDAFWGAFDKVEEIYLKPNGTQLYCSGDYSALYGKNDIGGVNFGQSVVGYKYIGVYASIQPYTKNRYHKGYVLNYDGNILDENSIDKRVVEENEQIPYGIRIQRYNDALKMNIETEESESERVDRSYSFHEKQINGQTYYALFKELKDGETAVDFVPKEQPTDKYTEYINQMYKKGLLFNNEMCFYKRGITRLDFGIVLGRAYCNATEYNLDEFFTETKFVDVNHPYCLYLSDNGILTSSNALGRNLYLNEREISKQVVSDALDKAAEKCGVLTEWKNTKVIQPTDAVCSRELAYVETFRLYELIKKHNNPNYSAFTSSQVLDSDSEAETMHYETVAYIAPNSEAETMHYETVSDNASNAETSTEMTTQATAVKGENVSKIAFILIIAFILGGIIVMFTE
ncbi:MAG: hypothetical protein IJ062_06140 [Firmicutes bacterium]|nr:hypothetical protein [Bacillota bacterium]